MTKLMLMYRQIEAETDAMRYNGQCEAHMGAVSNAADTCRDQGKAQCSDAFGTPSEDFLKFWFGSLQCILADITPDKEVRDWFEARGVNY